MSTILSTRTRGVLPRRDARGATLVESAIVIPVVLIIIFGIIEVAFIYRSAAVSTTASRAGARIGSASYGDYDIPGTTAAEQATLKSTIVTAVEVALRDLRDADAAPTGLKIYKADTDGSPIPADCSVDCISYTWDPTTKTFGGESGAWTTPDDCGSVLDRIGIEVTVRHEAFTPLAGIDVTLDKRTVMRLEPGPFGTCTVE